MSALPNLDASVVPGSIFLIVLALFCFAAIGIVAVRGEVHHLIEDGILPPQSTGNTSNQAD